MSYLLLININNSCAFIYVMLTYMVFTSVMKMICHIDCYYKLSVVICGVCLNIVEVAGEDKCVKLC